jgi:mannosyltransferase OCH1-like enzyme
VTSHRKLALPESEWLLTADTDEASGILPYDINNTAARIPRVIHKVFLSKNGKLSSLQSNEVTVNEGLQGAHQSWMSKNPGYRLHYYSLQDARAYLHRHFHPIFLRAFDCIEAFAGKTDFVRLAIVYREGGWYSDWKEECLKDGLLDWLATEPFKEQGAMTSAFFSRAFGTPHVIKYKYFMNGFFGAQPRHPGKDAYCTAFPVTMFSI